MEILFPVTSQKFEHLTCCFGELFTLKGPIMNIKVGSNRHPLIDEALQ